MKDRILVADDEEDIRWILETSLKKSGFEVECAENGEDAVRKAHEEAYSLILLDINMPDMNGFEVLSQLRDRGIDSPIIFITAQNTVSNAIDSMQLGAYDYLTKPFDLEEVKLFAERAIKSYDAGRKIRLSEDVEENISFEEIVGSSPRHAQRIQDHRPHRLQEHHSTHIGRKRHGKRTYRKGDTL